MRKTVPLDAVLIPKDAEKVFGGVIFDIYQWSQTLYDGSHVIFEMGRRPDTVLILAIVNNQVVVLSEQQPGKPHEYTLPGGRVDPKDSSWLEAAKREMLEETGMAFNKWRLIEVTQPTAKLEWFCPLYLAYDNLPQESPELDAGEKITLKRLSIAEIKELIDGEGKTGLGHLSHLLQDIESPDDILMLPEYQGKEIEVV